MHSALNEQLTDREEPLKVFTFLISEVKETVARMVAMEALRHTALVLHACLK